MKMKSMHLQTLYFLQILIYSQEFRRFAELPTYYRLQACSQVNTISNITINERIKKTSQPPFFPPLKKRHYTKKKIHIIFLFFPLAQYALFNISK